MGAHVGENGGDLRTACAPLPLRPRTEQALKGWSAGGRAGQGRVGELRQGTGRQSPEHPLYGGTSTVRCHNAQRPRLVGSKSAF